MWELIQQSRAGPAPADLGQRARHRPRQRLRRGGRRVRRHAGHQAACSSSRTTRSPRAWWSDATGSSRPRSCPAGLHVAGRLQRPVRRLADQRRTPGWCARIKARPVDLLDADRAAMLPLPPVPPRPGWRNRVRLGRDYYVRVDTNDYSVDPQAIGRFVDVTADLERVGSATTAACVADHARVWARGMTDHRPRPRRSRAAAARAVPAAPHRAGRPTAAGCGTWPTTTAPSASTLDDGQVALMAAKHASQTAGRRSSRSPTSPPR